MIHPEINPPDIGDSTCGINAYMMIPKTSTKSHVVDNGPLVVVSTPPGTYEIRALHRTSKKVGTKESSM